MLEEAQKLERARLEGAEERIYILSGILRCGECGSPLVGQASHGQSAVHRYCGHNKAFRKSDCRGHRISAKAVEEVILEYLWAAVRDAGYLQRIEKNVRDMRNVRALDSARDKRAYRSELANVQTRIVNLLLMQGQSTRPEALKQVMKTFEALCKQKSDLEVKLSRLNERSARNELVSESTQVIAQRLHEFERGFRKAKGSMKKRLLRKVLKQVVVTSEGLSIFMSLADGEEIPNHQLKLVRVPGPESEKKSALALTRKASGGDSKLSVGSSDIGKNGDPGAQSCNMA